MNFFLLFIHPTLFGQGFIERIGASLNRHSRRWSSPININCLWSVSSSSINDKELVLIELLRSVSASSTSVLPSVNALHYTANVPMQNGLDIMGANALLDQLGLFEALCLCCVQEFTPKGDKLCEVCVSNVLSFLAKTQKRRLITILFFPTTWDGRYDC